MTHGALLIEPVTGGKMFLGDHVPEVFVQQWKAAGKKQVISQAEIFPILVANSLWKATLSNRRILWFVEIESVFSVRNYSPAPENYDLLVLNACLDLELNSRHWYTRVPSSSNPSDSASRLDFEPYADAVRWIPDYSTLVELQKRHST